ncbi:MAG TPA: hypothetical protein VIV62_00860 [Chthoniobacterales bacterium]
MKKRLLVNWAFYRPVGHLLEALQHAYGYYSANCDKVDVFVAVNAASPITLVEACPWVSGVYPIDVAEVIADGEAASSIRAMGTDWDYVITDSRLRLELLRPHKDASQLIALQSALQGYLKGSVWTGFSRGWECRWNTTGLIGTDDPLPFAANARFRIPIPQDAQMFARRYQHDGAIFYVIPGGFIGPQRRPSLEAWREILAALAAELPNLRVYVTGVSASVSGQSYTRGVTANDVDLLAQKLPFVTNCFDIGLWNQIGLMAASDVLLAPHTGFAFLGQFVGTPWLALSGCPWPEYLFNGVPFYSVIPECESYPADGRKDSECNQRLARGRKTVCMEDESLRARIPDVIRGAHFLLDSKTTYERAIHTHVENLKRRNRSFEWFQYFLG